MDIQKEREAFEVWFESNFESTKLHKFDDGVYWHERAQMSWEAWQAAIARMEVRINTLDEILLNQGEALA